MNRYLPIIIICLLSLTSLFSCVDTAPTREVQLIDSLNRKAYAYRYKNLDTSYNAAMLAYNSVGIYKQGKAEACNNLGFCAFIQMDFDTAERLHKKVYDLTKNELELLIADIGLMKIYQRTAMNKEYYDYRNSAVRRMKRIDEENNLFVDRHEQLRINYAYTEFFIVSAIYYYYLQQRAEAMASLNEIHQNEELAADTNQYLYFHYIKGSAGLCEGETPDERKLHEFDELFTTWRLASQKGYLYFEGNGVQGLANLMASPESYRLFLARRSHALTRFGFPVDSLLPLRLGQLALKKFNEYDDLYQIAGAYVSIGKYLNAHGRYAEALDTLAKALDCVNEHHLAFYHHATDTLDKLQPFLDRDTVYTEVTWIGREKVKTVPEWISRIREQLSVSYAGLGMKVPSDYNRNIYLDILDYTRQDKEWESRKLSLEAESKQLNIILFFVIVGFLLAGVLFWILNKRSKARNRIYTSRLKLTLDICRKITASIPADITDENEIVQSITQAILPDMEQLLEVTEVNIGVRDEESGDIIFNSFYNEEKPAGMESDFDLFVPDKPLPIGLLKLSTRHRLGKDEQALVRVITPYIAWALDNGMTFMSLGEERNRLEKQKYVYEQHIAGNKRQNLIKKSCLAIVNGINPYIDRIINEVHKLTEKRFIDDAEIKKEKYQYIDELVTTINEYNDILALWIKMKQGSLSLNIESFALEELFVLIGKGRKAFEMKKQKVEIGPAPAIVKADKALTLFMINTLAENARKYTPEGGMIKVYAHATDEYAEISVEDNGRGLSPEDVAKIVGEKVYNSWEIGLNDGIGAEDLKNNKGSGFGLMNCKGIIEKYRKTNDFFNVCVFNVESTLGKGSRFYFRLPLGIKKTLGIVLCLLLPWAISSCHKKAEVPGQEVTVDSVTLAAEREYERLLDEASYFADTAYYCNVVEDYELALQYADSAINRLNLHYKTYALNPDRYMKLAGEGMPAELEWWDKMYDSDFHVILDIRNEAAVAFLALKQLDAYSYNNAAYTALYKLLGEDQSIESYCRQLQRSTTNRTVGIILCILLLGVCLCGYYLLYTRKRWMIRLNLEQVLEINKKVFDASLVRTEDSVEALQREEDTLKEIPLRIVNEAFDSVNELLIINRLGIAVYNETMHRLEFASNPAMDTLPEIVQQCFAQQVYLTSPGSQALPLLIDAGGEHQCVGVLYLEKEENANQETTRLLFQLISRYVAIVVFNAVVKRAMKYRDIESAHEDARRASREDSMLHVQNLVLDNCLSTIKHETIYYPNKIKQIIDRLNTRAVSGTEEKECVETISELIEYYKGIFTILSSCASRQLEEVTFRRTTIPVADLFAYAGKYFRKSVKGNPDKISFIEDPVDEKVTGDLIQLRFLFESLIDEALTIHQDGAIILKTMVDGEYIRFLFTDKRRNKTTEELNHLFYPDLARMTAGEKGELKGTEYLICKQIIRDHDEYAGRRGCRINAEPSEGGGFTVYFTIPKR